MKILIGLILGIAICGVLYGAYYFGTKTTMPKEVITQKQNVDQDPSLNKISPTPTPQVVFGSITGSISYPSEGIPNELDVCAYDINGMETECTSDRLNGDEFTYGVGYQMELLPGEYHVYAILNGGSGYKAYYSEAVLCGLGVDCTNHNPIVVTVTPNDLIKDIDPADWYDTSQN